MAARTRRGVKGGIRMSDEWRDKLRVSAIMRRLESGALGKIELSNEQLSAAKILLSKVVPDLARTELTGKDGGAVQYEAVGNIVDNLSPLARKELMLGLSSDKK